MNQPPDPSLPPAVARGSWSPTPAPGAVDGATVVPMFRLYTPGQIGVAAALGSYLGAAWLLAANYRRLRRPGAARLTLAIGATLTGGLIALGFVALLPSMAVVAAAAFPALLVIVAVALGAVGVRAWVDAPTTIEVGRRVRISYDGGITAAQARAALRAIAVRLSGEVFAGARVIVEQRTGDDRPWRWIASDDEVSPSPR